MLTLKTLYVTLAVLGLWFVLALALAIVLGTAIAAQNSPAHESDARAAA